MSLKLANRIFPGITHISDNTSRYCEQLTFLQRNTASLTAFPHYAVGNTLQHHCNQVLFHKNGKNDTETYAASLCTQVESKYYIETDASMSVQYTAIFHGYKSDYFQMKNCNIFLFCSKTYIVGTR